MVEFYRQLILDGFRDLKPVEFKSCSYSNLWDTYTSFLSLDQASSIYLSVCYNDRIKQIKSQSDGKLGGFVVGATGPDFQRILIIKMAKNGMLSGHQLLMEKILDESGNSEIIFTEIDARRKNILEIDFWDAAFNDTDIQSCLANASRDDLGGLRVRYLSEVEASDYLERRFKGAQQSNSVSHNS